MAVLAALPLEASTLPGFRIETLASTTGFATSIAIDSRGTIYYTSSDGGLFRLDGTASTRVAMLPTKFEGNAGLLGMALLDDQHAAVHYTNTTLTREIVSRVDLTTGKETVLVSFINDITGPDRPVSPEHHGGNPTVGADGSIYVAIGDFGGGAIAEMPEWAAGKIWRIRPDGRPEQFARGVRNSYDLAWDAAHQRVVMADNGPVDGDEINVVYEGDNLGWPFSWGNGPALGGSIAPSFVWQTTIAPTGIVQLTDRHPLLRGYLFCAFTTSAIYLVPDIDARPLPAPLALIEKETRAVIDAAQAPNGDVYFATFDAIHRLIAPAQGDCNGDGRLDAIDVTALSAELRDGNPQARLAAAEGRYAGSFGCDVDANGTIDNADLIALVQRVKARRRSAGK